MVQALYFSVPFRKQVLSYYSTVTTDEYEDSDTMLMALAEVFHEIHSNKKQYGTYKPQKIVKRLQTQNGMYWVSIYLSINHSQKVTYLFIYFRDV